MGLLLKLPSLLKKAWKGLKGLHPAETAIFLVIVFILAVTISLAMAISKIRRLEIQLQQRPKILAVERTRTLRGPVRVVERVVEVRVPSGEIRTERTRETLRESVIRESELSARVEPAQEEIERKRLLLFGRSTDRAWNLTGGIIVWDWVLLTAGLNMNPERGTSGIFQVGVRF